MDKYGSVTQYGKKLDPEYYVWDSTKRIFSTTENNLVVDYWGIDEITFITGDNCTFDTCDDCTFKTGFNCTFKTGHGCTFKTGSGCTFDTGFDCTFDTGAYCTFKTGFNCTFKTGHGCTFDTGDDCTFKTGEKCVVVRRDIFEVITLTGESNHIKLNDYPKAGYVHINEVHTIIVDGEEVELSNDSYEIVKKLMK